MQIDLMHFAFKTVLKRKIIFNLKNDYTSFDKERKEY